MSRPSHGSDGLTGRHVLVLLGGFFAIVFAVNAYFIRMALSTHTGVVANEPYRKGLKYNERIAAAKRQESLGWMDDVAFSSDGRRIVISLRDGAGMPVGGLALTATLGRPATARNDVAVTLGETLPGRYEAIVTLAGGGAYIATFEAQDPLSPGAGVLYRGRKRLWLNH